MLKHKIISTRISVLLLVPLLLSLNNTFAQRPIFRSFNVEVETEEATIHAVAQDANNYLYFGTDKGLVKYNGIEARPVRIPDSISINSISALLMAGDSTLWIGGNGGELHVLANNQFRRFRNSAFKPISKITAIYEDTQGSIWIATYGDGAYRIKNNIVYNLNSENGLSDNYTYTIYEDEDNLIWIGTDAGITVFNSRSEDENSVFRYLSTKNGLPDNIVKVIRSTKQKGEVWIAMQDSGICKYDIEAKMHQRIFTKGNHWSYGGIGTMIIDINGDIWAGTSRRGVVRIIVQKNITNKRSGKLFDIRVYNATNGLSGNAIITLFEDDENNVWIGTRKGSNQFARSAYEYLTDKDGLPSKSVYALLVDTKDNYWICTEHEVIKYTYLPSGEVAIKTYLPSKGKLNQQVVSIYEDSNHNIWMGTYGNGVYRLNPATDKINLISEREGLANNNIMSITEDDFGVIWLATLGGVTKITMAGTGYSEFDVTNYTRSDGLGSNYVYYVYHDKRNHLWFATDGGGISKHDGEEFVPIVFPKVLKSTTNYSITDDSRGSLWFSNAEGGIYKYDGKSIVNFNNALGLRDNSASILTTGVNGEIIVAHSKGIDILPKGQKMFKEYNLDWTTFEFNPSLNAFYNDKAGNIWIGTSSGVVKFRYVDDRNEKESPVIILNNIRVEEQNISFTNPGEYKSDQNQFAFEFLGVWLKSPETVMYRYKLEGYEDSWSRVTKERFVTYANLPPGEYVFMVKSRTVDGSWNETPASYSFTINPPLRQTWWFITLCGLGIWGLLYVGYSSKLKSLLADRRRLEDKVIESREEIIRLKNEIEENSGFKL